MQRPDPLILVDRRLKIFHELDNSKRPWCLQPTGLFGHLSDLNEEYIRCEGCTRALAQVGVKVQ